MPCVEDKHINSVPQLSSLDRVKLQNSTNFFSHCVYQINIAIQHYLHSKFLYFMCQCAYICILPNACKSELRFGFVVIFKELTYRENERVEISLSGYVVLCCWNWRMEHACQWLPLVSAQGISHKHNALPSKSFQEIHSIESVFREIQYHNTVIEFPTSTNMMPD